MTNVCVQRHTTVHLLSNLKSLLMPHHHLHSSPETCHWGFFEAKLKPVLTIASGDEVTIDTVSGGPEVVPDKSKFHVPPELAEIHAQMRADGAGPYPDRPDRGRRAPNPATCWRSTSSTSSSGRIGATI